MIFLRSPAVSAGIFVCFSDYRVAAGQITGLWLEDVAAGLLFLALIQRESGRLRVVYVFRVLG